MKAQPWVIYDLVSSLANGRWEAVKFAIFKAGLLLIFYFFAAAVIFLQFTYLPDCPIVRVT